MRSTPQQGNVEAPPSDLNVFGLGMKFLGLGLIEAIVEDATVVQDEVVQDRQYPELDLLFLFCCTKHLQILVT